ncbi:hypothetical protein ACJIZ3_023147 [Penstemon smallii]|uniref:Histone H2A n=1 Tax=Penstemon smallii TaxID=265156 RepID=A0ABD3TPJ9_9LAMI
MSNMSVLDVSWNEARDVKTSRIGPIHIQLDLGHDEELSQLLGKVIIPNVGVLPHIHHNLLPKSSGEEERTSDSRLQNVYIK